MDMRKEVILRMVVEIYLPKEMVVVKTYTIIINSYSY